MPRPTPRCCWRSRRGARPWSWPSCWPPGCAPAPTSQAVAVARPGFVNLRLRDDFWRAQVKVALAAGRDYGAADLGRGRRVNVEYCSANPTGPLHVGHGRGTVFGDALASLLAKMGFAVTREYYVNDHGAQVDVLARSVHHRYLEALGRRPRAARRVVSGRGADRGRRGDPRSDGRPLAARDRGRLAAGVPQPRHRRDAGADPRRSRGARRAPRRVHLGGGAGRRRPDRGGCWRSWSGRG